MVTYRMTVSPAAATIVVTVTSGALGRGWSTGARERTTISRVHAACARTDAT